MIPWDLLIDLGLGATLKQSNMAAIFKMATKDYEILITI